ncbi:hypothetical protein Tsubulata_015489 [Turnera subulata]|uniref:BLOC-1-related complex subunit 6 C-terminal helix domain-containing protein n=1 Tax=Turnera subulata TaxID=218843 RepID=A0A9Q0FQ38_9ROSI|nr:hypothetical protein Tsubulata_015489 [Turnera subulata]
MEEDEQAGRIDGSTDHTESSGTVVSGLDPPSTCPGTEPDQVEVDPKRSEEIFKAIEVVERDSLAIAESFSSLFSSLRLALSEVTSGSVDHMRCFGDATGRLQESVLDAATKGNRYINSCLRFISSP